MFFWIPFLFSFSFLLSFLGTIITRKIALKLQFLDKPRGIKKHKKPTPYLGGLSIYFAFVFSIIFFVFKKPEFKEPKLLGIILGATIIMFLGLIDDLKNLSYQIKLLGQLVGAIILILFDIKINFIENLFVSIPLTILWVIGITNAFNTIDIMDGLAGGIGIIVSFTFFLIGTILPNFSVCILSIILAGSLSGFLKFNFPNASIFMGDCGSLFIGFILAAFSLAESYTIKNNISIFAPLLILGVPIYDIFSVMILRTLKKQSIFKGSEDHLAIRLNVIFKNKTKVVIILCLITTVLCTIAYLSILTNTFLAGVIYFLIINITFIFGYKCSKIKVK